MLLRGLVGLLGVNVKDDCLAVAANINLTLGEQIGYVVEGDLAAVQLHFKGWVGKEPATNQLTGLLRREHEPRDGAVPSDLRTVSLYALVFEGNFFEH